jgi:hypothetical protein
MPKTIKNKRIKKQLVLLSALVVLIGISAYLLLSKPKHNEQVTATNTTSSPTINMKPATEQEKQAAEDHKNQLLNDAGNTATSSGQKKTVTPVISYIGLNGQQIEIDSFVGGVREDGADCTATLTSQDGQEVVTEKSVSFKDATTTSCTPIYIARSKLLKTGTWSVVVSYSSATAQGKSEPKTLEIK